MKNFYLGLFGIIVVLCLPQCRGGNTAESKSDNTGLNALEQRGLATGVQYARGFTIRQEKNYTELCIIDPWKRSDTFAVYHVVKDVEAMAKHHDDSQLIVANPQRWAIFSTTHVGFLEALGASDHVIGCTTPNRLYNAQLHKKFVNGGLIRIGSDMEYNFESLINQRPDIIIQTGFAGQKSKDARIRQTGTQLVYVMEWMEPTPLGRAEWIKVFGLLLNKKEEADSVFLSVEKAYNDLKLSLGSITDRQKVLVGNNFKGTWYMPGGENYMSHFLSDAGFSYPWADSKESGSLPLSFESVFNKFSDASVWLNVSSNNLEELKTEDPRYALIQAFKKGQVYSINNRVSRGTSNDFWEGAVIHPDWVLADLIYIAHPEILPGHSMVYYKKLQ
ncbi:MAG: ABC transporter substrate-binding protein [Bacteroidales bacterium]|nr:ABC transporter substrate-binding protein [Bacteroidales bacterium]